MVKLIAGKKGSGKSKRIMKMANEAVEDSQGHMIFIDDDKRAIYDLKHDLRFVNMEEFPVETSDEFLGFLCGLISNDYDIEKIYIDGILNVVKMDIAQLSPWINKLNKIAEKNQIEFIVALSHEGNLPTDLESFII